MSMGTISWSARWNTTQDWETMLEPTEFSVEYEDLDANSYRSVVSGNLIDSVISRNWVKLQFKYTGLNYDQANNIITKVTNNPVLVKIKLPFHGEMQAEFRCSKKSITRMMVGGERYELSFNLVQKKRIANM